MISLLNKKQLLEQYMVQNIIVIRLRFLKNLKFSQLTCMHLAKIMFFYKNARLPACFNNTWLTRMDRDLSTGGPLLRNPDEFEYVVPFARTDQLRRFPLTSAPEAWNALPVELKLLPTIYSFCSNLKKNYLSSLPSIPECTRLYCPVCQVLP
jgi:hypothetical protein